MWVRLRMMGPSEVEGERDKPRMLPAAVYEIPSTVIDRPWALTQVDNKTGVVVVVDLSAFPFPEED